MNGSVSDAPRTGDGAYQAWMRKVDRLTRAAFGIGYDDLPDLLFTRDAFNQGRSAEDFFDEDVRRVVHEEFGALAEASDGKEVKS